MADLKRSAKKVLLYEREIPRKWREVQCDVVIGFGIGAVIGFAINDLVTGIGIGGVIGIALAAGVPCKKNSPIRRFSKGKIVAIASLLVMIGIALVTAGLLYPAHTKMLTISMVVSGAAFISVFGYALIQGLFIFFSAAKT